MATAAYISGRPDRAENVPQPQPVAWLPAGRGTGGNRPETLVVVIKARQICGPLVARAALLWPSHFQSHSAEAVRKADKAREIDGTVTTAQNPLTLPAVWC